jgi:putative glycosyl hydrolase-like family 15 (GHL15) protein
MAMYRRDFLKNTLTLATAASMLPLSGNAVAAPSMVSSLLPAAWSNGMPPLFCTAYIDPTIQSHKGQEAMVAKFPVALVPQDNRLVYQIWRDKVKSINPSIKLLAYQQVNSEALVPGIGHDIMRKINSQDVWVTYPPGSGILPTAFGGRRLYDPRNEIWQNAFLDACEKVYNSYPFDGLFLDNCTVFYVAAPIPSLRIAMVDALRQVLVKLRKRLPNAILIGNGIDHFPSLNGAMNEDRPKDLAAEMSLRDNKSPIINLYQCVTNMSQPDTNHIKANLEIALRNKCFFGLAALNDYQHIQWPEIFNEVVSAYSPPKTPEPLDVQLR